MLLEAEMSFTSDGGSNAVGILVTHQFQGDSSWITFVMGIVQNEVKDCSSPFPKK